jgi:hypothetical protein
MVFSFLTSKISIALDENKTEFRPGELVTGKVKLHTCGKVNARKFHIVLSCVEWMNPNKSDNEEEAKEVSLWKKNFELGEKGEYKAGEWVFGFQLPPQSIPTIACEPRNKFCQKGAGVKWFLHAQMDIPSSLDLHAFKQVFVY